MRPTESGPAHGGGGFMFKQLKLILWLTLLFLPQMALAGASGSFSSSDGAYFDSGMGESILDIAVDTFTAGGPYVYAVGGSSMAFGYYYESFIFKYDKDGNMLSSATYSNPYVGSDMKDYAHAVALASNGDIFVGGASQQSDSFEKFFIIKYASDLSVISSVTFVSPEYPFYNMVYDMAIDHGGNVIAAGPAHKGAGNFDYLVVKYNSNLVFVSSASYDYADTDAGGESSNGCGVAVNSSDDIIVTGESWNAAYDFDMVTLKWNSALSGAPTVVTGDPTYDDGAYAVAVDTSDNIIIGGYINMGVNNDEFKLIKYDPNLSSVIHASTVTISGQNDGIRDIMIASNGDMYAAGTGNTGKWETARCSSSLQKLAIKEYTNNYGSDVAYAVARGTGSYIYVAGRNMNGGGDQDARIIRYDTAVDFIADITAPAQVTNLAAQGAAGMGTNMAGALLTWSAPGDDGWITPLPSGSEYAIQYSTYNGGWSLESPYTNAYSTDSIEPGTLVSYTMDWLMANKVYYFKVWHKDNSGNWSSASNVASLVTEVIAGAPDRVVFENYNLTLQKDVQSAPIGLKVYDFGWNVTKATTPITVYLSGRLNTYIGNEYEVDTSAVFYDTSNVAVTQITIPTDSYGNSFSYMTSHTPYTVIMITYTVNGIDRTEFMWPTIVTGGITASRVHKGDYTEQKSLSMGSSEMAYIDFGITDTDVNWEVRICTSSDREGVPVWTYYGWGVPYPGQIVWNGNMSYYDSSIYTWREERAPNGTYYVRIQLGAGGGIKDDSISISVASQEIYGRVTNLSGEPLSEVYIYAYGPASAYTISDSTGYYKLAGLVAGTYYLNFFKYGYTAKNATSTPGLLNVQLGSPSYLKINAKRALTSNPDIGNPEQWGSVYAHNEGYTENYWGTLHYETGISTSDNSMYTYQEGNKYEIENSTDNPYDGGKWTIIEVDPGDYSLQMTLDGFTTISMTTSVVSGQTVTLDNLSFERKKTVFGYVALASTSASETYVSVEAIPAGQTWATGWGWVQIPATVSSGTYTIFGLDSGAYTLKARAPGYSKGQASVSVSAEETTAPDITLTEGGVLSGTLTVEGDTLSDTMFSLMGDPYNLYLNAWSPDAYSYGWTDLQINKSAASASASFSMKGLEDGTYWLNSWLNGFELEGAVGWNGVSAVVSGGTGTVNLKFKRYSGTIQAAITIPGGGSYNDVKIYLEGGNFYDSNWYNGSVTPMNAATFGGGFNSGTGVLTTPKLGTGSYRIKAVYTPTGMTKTKYLMVSNGETKQTTLDLSGNTYSISGAVSISQSNPPKGINEMSVLVDTAPTYNNNMMFAPTYMSTTAFRVVALDYNKITSGVMMDFKNGLIDSSGTYTISGLVPGIYMLIIPGLEIDGVYENGKETANVEEKVVVSGNITGKNLVVSKGYSVSGQVKLPPGETANEVMSIFINVFRADKSANTVYSGAGAWSNIVGNISANFSAGQSVANFTINGLAPGEYLFSVNEPPATRRYASAAVFVKVESSNLNGKNIQLTKGGKVVFKLRDANSGTIVTPKNRNMMLPPTYEMSAIANPWVEGGWYTIETMAESMMEKFELTYLPEGTYDVILGQSSYGMMAAAAGVAFTGGNQTNYASKTITGVKVKEGQTVDLGIIDVKQGLTITGTVKDENGTAIPNIPVIAIPALSNEWSASLRGFTDTSGKYSIVGIDPDITYYDIIACPRIDPEQFGGYFFFGAGGLMYGEKVKSMVKVSEVSVVDFVLSAAKGSLRGVITTEDGGLLQNPDDTNLPTAKVFMQPEDSMPRTNPIGDIVADTEINGSFSVEALSPGQYRLFILSGGYASYSKTVTIAETELNVGTIQLKRGAKISGTITKPDGKNPSTTEIKSILAATDDLSEMLVGSLKITGDKAVTGYEINGMQQLNSYNVMFLGEGDELITAFDKSPKQVIGYTVPFSSYTKTDFDLTFKMSSPAVFSRARKTGTSTYSIVYDLTGAVRKTIPADDDLTKILTVVLGNGAISGQYMSPNRKSLSCTYTAPAGEKQFSIRLHTYAKAVNPETGTEFEVDETLQYLTGIGAKNKVKVSNLRGGRITLDGDSSSVAFGPGAFDVNSSTVVVFVTFSRAESLEDIKSSASLKKGQRFAIPKQSGAYPDRVYAAMKLAQAANVDPFSSFYDVMLPAGISHALKGAATLNLQYSSDVDPNTLNIYYYDEKNNVYLLEKSNKKIDSSTKVISITVKHLSTFVLLQSDAQVIQGSSYEGPVFAYNFPNPFNLAVKSVNLVNASNQTASISGTMIHYGLPSTVSGEVEIRIYNVAGELVRTLNDGARTGGAHYYTEWDGKNEAGKKVASGVYIGRFSVDKKNEKFIKMAIIK